MAPRYDATMVEKVFDWVREHPLPDGRIIPICVWGEKGTGKTQLIRSYASKNQIGFNGYHPVYDASGSDMAGLAYLDERIGRTMYALPRWLPIENDSVTWHQRGIIFIDELNRANEEVLAGLMEPLGEGSIEQADWHLPPGWSFICAANPPSGDYQVRQLDEALMDRMVHIALGFDHTLWATWARSSGVAGDVTSFVSRFPGLMAKADMAMPEGVEISATPRSMEYLARLYEPKMDRELLTVLAHGLIGKVAGDAFIAHVSDSDQPVSAEDIFTGRFKERLGAHLQGGRHDLIDAASSLLVAAMAGYAPPQAEDTSFGALEQIGVYMQMIGPGPASALVDDLHNQAPAWIAPLERILGQRLERSPQT